MSNGLFDVGIVGASLSGAAAAMRLADSGLRVALIDKSEFPRRKVCGEGLSGGGLRALESLGVLDEVKALPHAPISGYTICRGPNESRLNFSSDSTEICHGAGVRRLDLDSLLVRKASLRPEIELYLGSKISTLSEKPGYWSIDCGSQRFDARFLVLASGARSVLANRIGVPEKKSGRERYALSFSLEGQWHQVPQTVFIFVDQGQQICCTPLSDSQLNISVLANKSSAAAFRDPTFVKETLRRIVPRLEFQGELISEPRGVGLLGHTRRASTYGQNVFLVGDCCEQLDPIGGLGMTHGLLTGISAAESIRQICQQQRSAAEAIKSYQRAREAAARPLRGFTRLSYLSLVRLNQRNFLENIESSPFASQIGQRIHGIPAEQSLGAAFAQTLLTCCGVSICGL